MVRKVNVIETRGQKAEREKREDCEEEQTVARERVGTAMVNMVGG